MNKSIKYVIIAIVVIGATAYFSYSYFTNSYYYSDNVNHDGITNDKTTQGSSTKETRTTTTIEKKSVVNQVAEKDKQYVCGDNVKGSSYYINEYVIPIPCSQPVGLTVDKDNHIWIAADWAGYLLVFDPSSNTFVKTIQLPNWFSQGQFGSMVWDMKFDKNGDLWFTDEKTNSIWKYFTKENKFEKYKLPTRGGYPVSFVFDSNDRIWFTEVFGKKLGFLDPLKVENNTTKGISELELSKQINFDTMGPISNSFGFNHSDTNNNKSNTNESLWFSTVNFPIGGQLVKYDIAKRSLTIYDLTNQHAIPLSVAEDEKGSVWTNDHASSLFMMLDPTTGYAKQYATSFPSTANTTTLPYYNQYMDGKIWFNEHYGNAIASYDIKNKTLVEYHIPTKDPLWGNASNPLRFTFDNDGSVWFTEWTENKIGVLHKEKMSNFPILISTSKDTMSIDRTTGKGDTIDVYVYKNNLNDINSSKLLANGQIDKPNNITMFATSSISKIGSLSNLTSNFSKDHFSTTDMPTSSTQPYKITLEISPTKDVVPGNYTLTISSRYNNEVTYSKIMDLNIG